MQTEKQVHLLEGVDGPANRQTGLTRTALRQRRGGAGLNFPEAGRLPEVPGSGSWLFYNVPEGASDTKTTLEERSEKKVSIYSVHLLRFPNGLSADLRAGGPGQRCPPVKAT